MTPADDPAVTSVRALHARIDAAMCRDRGPLRRQLARLRAQPRDAELRARLLAAIDASVAQRAARAASLPVPRLDANLPIAPFADDIIAAIEQHPVVVVAGETGSGKTTQLPQLCLAAGRGAAGMIGCTQPRRIAARSVAHRVASELQVALGGMVGWQVRFGDHSSENTVIKFMTDGILLAAIQKDRWLSAYDTIILDEAHERSLNIDFLLGYLKTLLPKRRDLKLIVTSATIDTERFSRFFDGAPVIEVPGRSFPVEVRWRPLRESEDAAEDGVARASATSGDAVIDGIVGAIDELTREDPLGDILVFLPGEREIRDAHLALARRKYRATRILALYARLSARAQDRVFNPEPGRRIVLATNVAETSLTVPRIRYVVDPGLARVKRYSPRQKLDRLHIEPISRASADQRKGRCGRVAAGVCVRLYSEADWHSRPAFTDPEIRRASLADVILRMLSLGLGRIEDFPFIEPPDGRAIADGWQQLLELGAVDAARRLTDVGRAMARLPIDVKLARMLVAARELGALREMLAIAAFLSIQDPRERPAEAIGSADTAHAEFFDGKSDFNAILGLWHAWQDAHAALTQSRLREWCAKRFLSFLRMREWRELHRQLLLLCAEAGWTLNTEPATYAQVHRSLIAGMPTQIGQRIDKRLYQGPRGRRFALFPGSSLARTPPPWVLSANLLDTRRVWGLNNARIEPDWVIAQVPHLLARKHFDPHWSRAQGRVIASEQISLFGLVLAPKRPVGYANIDPLAAREIFVREGLVRGEVNTRLPFLQRNLATLERARAEEARQRRVGLVVDEDWQARWYLDRLPASVHGSVALERWYARLDDEQRAALEWRIDDLLVGAQTEESRFPAFLTLADARLPLSYRFEPGAVDDGVTVHVPIHLLSALDAARLSWLVPGLVEEKTAALIRALPKAQRRNYVPATDFARAFAEAWPQPSADALEGELARFLSRVTGAPIAASDFLRLPLPAHLRMNLRLLDQEQRVLAEDRDLAALQAQWRQRADEAFAAFIAGRGATTVLYDFPEQGVPDTCAGAAGLPAFPALQGDAAGVRIHVFADRERAEAAHSQAVRGLLQRALAALRKQAARQLPVSQRLGMVYSAIESSERLRADLIEAAFAAVCGDDLAAVRTRADYLARRDAIGKALFPAAIERLRLAESILTEYARLKPLLEPPLLGWGAASYADMRAQLAALVYPGFLRTLPAAALNELPRWLRALQYRAERVRLDAQRDQARLLELQPFLTALAAAKAAGVAEQPDWQRLRWNLEELRVVQFAQPLAARGAVSRKRLNRELAALRATLSADA